MSAIRLLLGHPEMWLENGSAMWWFGKATDDVMRAVM